MSDESKCGLYTRQRSYDHCKFRELETFFVRETGCSVPYVLSNVSICDNSTAIKMVRVNSRNIYVHPFNKKYFTNITLGHWCVRQRCGAGRQLQGTLREDGHCVRLPLPVGGRGHRLRLRQALLQEHREGHRGPPGLLHTQECAIWSLKMSFIIIIAAWLRRSAATPGSWLASPSSTLWWLARSLPP